MSAPLHLAITPDEAYFRHAAAMLHSVFENGGATSIHVHLLHEASLTATAIQPLAGFVQGRGGQFTAHAVPDAWLQAIAPHPYYPVTVWLKIFAATLIDERRLLYLDCDLIVRSDLLPLWQLDLHGRWLAAVRDAMPLGAMSGDEDAHLIRMGLQPPEPRFNRGKHLARLGLEEPAEYFNSGVMLLDLDAFRAHGVTERLLDYARAPDTLKIYPEQDALNAIAKNRWQSLPACWNVVQATLKNAPLEVPIPSAELREARYTPHIVHFCGFDKPWKPSSQHPFRGEYLRHRQATPWADGGDYTSLGAITRFYLALPLAVRVWLYGWSELRYRLQTRLLQAHGSRPLWIRPRWLGGALLQRLPPGWSRLLRRAFSPLLRRAG